MCGSGHAIPTSHHDKIRKEEENEGGEEEKGGVLNSEFHPHPTTGTDQD